MPFPFSISFQLATEWATFLSLVRGSLAVHSVIVKHRAHITLRDRLGFGSGNLPVIEIISAAIQHHRHLQPALLRSVTQACLSTRSARPCAMAGAEVTRSGCLPLRHTIWEERAYEALALFGTKAW